MSFSAEIKEELCRIRLKTPALQRAQLAGLTQTCASLRIGRTPQVLYQSESSAVIRHIAQLGTALYALEAVTFRREQEHRRQALSAVTFSGADCRRLLTDTGVLRESDGALSFEKRIPAAAESDPECRRAFLRGAFLGSGSCSNPAGGYHLEIVCRTDAFAAGLVELMEHSGIAARATTRKGRPLVYLKGEEVAAFLALTGANAAALSVENTRTERDFRNYINRKSNCETANIGKTVNAGLQQLQAIATIEAHMALTELPAPLYEAARLRLAHPDATLQELADLAEIGKSGMNHRLSRLLRIAEELGG